jgi:hypothetical protein
MEESSGVADAIQELFTILDGEVGASLSSCEKAGETFPVAAAVGTKTHERAVSSNFLISRANDFCLEIGKFGHRI